MAMHNIEIEDFYHHDFTTASEWEVFIARLEEILYEWKLSQTNIGLPLEAGDFVNLTWKTHTEELTFADVSFVLKHFKLSDTPSEEFSEDDTHQAHIDVLNISNDFTRLDDDHLEIARYFGIREFIVLTPSAKRVTINDETRIKILISSLRIALNNASCQVPALVQVQEPWQKFYLGVNVGKGSSSTLDMIHLKKMPPHCRHLTGLLALFKQKIGDGYGVVRLDPVMVAIRFSYVLKDWTNHTWTQEPPDFDFMQGETVGVAELGKLPFGATFDPIGKLELFTTWPRMSENVVVDSEGFTDLEPQLAPEWSARVEMAPATACLLGEYLTDFLHLVNNDKTLVDLLGDVTLTQNKSTKKITKNVDGPIPEQVLISILYFLFPDAEENPVNIIAYKDEGNTIEENLWRGVKTCALDGLVWRLAIVAAHCTHNLGGVVALAQLWHEFIEEIRFRWEHSILIPGVASGFPDSVRTCLLHQKLQMINCCIERKKNREQKCRHSSSVDFSESESDDEQFYECTEDLLWNRPVGRLAKHPSLRLVKTGDALYLPITQDPVPKTEDQLEEDAEIMMQLGTDKNASEMRARLMSASLLSDMESFKAANPGSELDDFIRWYSPRDWIENDLSPRMKIPNNPWSSTWASAQPVPAHRQKRLFDDSREAEKAIHYISLKRIGEIAQLLLPVLTHAALVTLGQQKHDALPNLPDVTQSILNKLQYATKPLYPKVQLYEEIARDIEAVEVLVAQVQSLQHKFCDDEQTVPFIIQLMRGKEVKIDRGSRGIIGQRISSMFYSAQKSIVDEQSSKDCFPEPSCKEFILRAVIPRPSPASARQPQRLYICLERDSIRLAGYFSEDTTF